MSHLPRPTSAASTSSSSGIGTLPAGSKIPKPGFIAPGVTTSTPTSAAATATTDKNEADNFKVGDKVKFISHVIFIFEEALPI